MKLEFEVVKRNKRLWIARGEELIYTPPDFLRHHLQSREPMRSLASKFNEVGGYDITSIVEFEGEFK